MKPSNHLSDLMLKQIVAEEVVDEHIKEAETHISKCSSCQQRLLAAAAGEGWRSEFYDGVSDLIHSSADTLFFAEESQPRTKAQGDSYDLFTVRKMLTEILDTPSHPETLGKLGRYEIESVIGCGGMGVVLKGFDKELHRPVAIKMILPRFSRDGTAKQRFLQEARAAATILHPNVIEIHDINKVDSVPWFVMTYIAGPSLRDLVDRDGPLPEKEIIRIAVQIAAGLSVAHKNGVVHRDIKPENILVDNQVNRVVITDFGLACRNTDQRMTQTGILAGSIGYMSPEQSRGEDLDGRSDLFSLGSLLFFLGSGQTPFASENIVGTLTKINSEKHPDVRKYNPDLSWSFVQILDLLLQKSPDKRLSSANELEGVLTDYLAHLHQPTKMPSPIFRRRKGRSAVIAGAVGIFAMLTISISIVAGWSYWGNTSGPSNSVEKVSSDAEFFHSKLMDEIEQDAKQLGADMLEFERQTSSKDAGQVNEEKDFLSSEFQGFKTDLDQFEKSLSDPFQE